MSARDNQPTCPICNEEFNPILPWILYGTEWWSRINTGEHANEMRQICAGCIPRIQIHSPVVGVA